MYGTIHLTTSSLLTTKLEQILKVVLKIHLPCTWETKLTGDLCPLTKGNGSDQSATFEASAIRRVGGAENIVADNWPMITSEVNSAQHGNPPDDGGRRQQEIHLRLFLSSRYQEIFHRAPGAAGGRCKPLSRVSSAHRSNSYKNSANHASLSASFSETGQQTEGVPNYQSSAHRCNRRDECLCPYQTQTCRHPRYPFRTASRKTV